MKKADQLAHDMRGNRALLEAVAVDLATTTPGDWDTLIQRLAARGYQITADEIQSKLKKIKRRDPGSAALIDAWL